jgi:hypothetical protein
VSIFLYCSKSRLGFRIGRRREILKQNTALTATSPVQQSPDLVQTFSIPVSSLQVNPVSSLQVNPASSLQVNPVSSHPVSSLQVNPVSSLQANAATTLTRQPSQATNSTNTSTTTTNLQTAVAQQLANFQLVAAAAASSPGNQSRPTTFLPITYIPTTNAATPNRVPILTPNTIMSMAPRQLTGNPAALISAAGGGGTIPMLIQIPAQTVAAATAAQTDKS